MNNPVEGSSGNQPTGIPFNSDAQPKQPPVFVADTFAQLQANPSFPQGYTQQSNGTVAGPGGGLYIPTDSNTDSGETIYFEENSEKNFTFGTNEAGERTRPELYNPGDAANHVKGHAGEKLVEQDLIENGWTVINQHSGNDDQSFSEEARASWGQQGIDTIAYRVEGDEATGDRTVHVLVIETKSTGPDVIRPNEGDEAVDDLDDVEEVGGYDPDELDREIEEENRLIAQNADYWETHDESEMARAEAADKNNDKPRVSDPGGVGDLGITKKTGPQLSNDWVAARIVEHAQASDDPEAANMWPDATVNQRVIKAEVSDVIPGETLDSSSGTINYYNAIDHGGGNVEVDRDPTNLSNGIYDDPFDATNYDLPTAPASGSVDENGNSIEQDEVRNNNSELDRSNPSLSPFSPLSPVSAEFDDPAGGSDRAARIATIDSATGLTGLEIGNSNDAEQSGLASVDPGFDDNESVSTIDSDANFNRLNGNDGDSAVNFNNNGLDTDRRFETTSNASGTLYESDFSTGDSVAEVGFESEHVNASLRGPGYEVGGNASLSIDGGAINASAEANAAVYLAQAEFDANYGPVSASGSAMVGAEASAGTELAFDPMSGDIGAGVDLEAFAGGRAQADVGVAISDNASVNGGGYVSYGVGAEFEADVGLEDGKFSADFDIGATLGVGAGFDVAFEVDVVETAGDVVNTVGDVGGAVSDVGESIGGGIKKLGGLFG